LLLFDEDAITYYGKGSSDKKNDNDYFSDEGGIRTMIDIRNLSVQFTGENLFEKVNLKINRNDKIALVGSNGKGKSTFFKLIIGLEKPETGEISRQKGIRIGYLPQDLLSFKGKTLLEEVKSSLLELKTLDERENHIVEDLNSESLDNETHEMLY
jgi:ATP-binding cassette subfamily F protein 3